MLRDLSPDRVALFGYAHVPWLKAHQRKIEEDTLPKATERLALFQAGVEAFVGAGYEFIGLDHFAKPDRRDGDARAPRATSTATSWASTRRPGSDMVAFGITGIGDTGGVYLQNRHALVGVGARPRRRAPSGPARLPPHDDDALRGTIIQELMCNGRVSRAMLEAAAARPGARSSPPSSSGSRPMVADGIVLVIATTGSG